MLLDFSNLYLCLPAVDMQARLQYLFFQRITHQLPETKRAGLPVKWDRIN